MRFLVLYLMLWSLQSKAFDLYRLHIPLTPHFLRTHLARQFPTKRTYTLDEKSTECQKLCFSPCGAHLFALSTLHPSTLLDIETKQIVRSFYTSFKGACALNEHELVYSQDSGDMTSLDIRANARIRISYDKPDHLYMLDTHTLFYSVPGELRVLDLRTGRPQTMIADPAIKTHASLAVSPNKQFIAYLNNQLQGSILEASRSEAVQTIQAPLNMQSLPSLAINNHGICALITQQIMIMLSTKNECIKKIKRHVRSPQKSLASWNNYEDTLGYVSDTKTIKLYDTRREKNKIKLRHNSTITDFTTRPQSCLWAIASKQKPITLYRSVDYDDYGTVKALQELEPHL